MRKQDTNYTENNRIHAAYPHLRHKQYLQWPSSQNSSTIQRMMRGFMGFGCGFFLFFNLEGFLSTTVFVYT